jgi:tRNA G26 N,N-dimethylase Trm1
MERILVEEGDTRFFVPQQDLLHAFPPSTAGIFYNRRMELNRDATVLFISNARPDNYLDAMGATGVRGLRVASECGIPVTINDRDPVAAGWIRENVDFTGRDIDVTCGNIHTLLSVKRFDAVDLDPYGSPAPYIDSAIRGTGRFLLVTATDTAPLCGAHRKAGIRRYFANPVNTEYHAETGLRTLLGFIVRETVKYDRGIEPLFCFAREHYVRAHFRISSGADMIATLPGFHFGTKTELMNLLSTLRDELPTSSFYDYHLLAKQAKISPGPIADLLEGLREKGYGASRVHYSGTGVKTDAPAAVILDVMRSGQVAVQKRSMD